jgi:hypothetical protein
LTGELLEQVRQRNMEEMMAGAEPQRDIVSHGEYQGAHRGRQVDIAKKLLPTVIRRSSRNVASNTAARRRT